MNLTPRLATLLTLPPLLWAGNAVVGRLMVGIGAFEIGNVAATLLILRATEQLRPGRSNDSATQKGWINAETKTPSVKA